MSYSNVCSVMLSMRSVRTNKWRAISARHVRTNEWRALSARHGVMDVMGYAATAGVIIYWNLE